MCFDYDESPEFYTIATVNARKKHRCSACRSVIDKGEKYERFSGKFDGEIFTEKLCRRCCYDRNRIVEHELAEGCHESEAWPAVQDIIPYLQETGMFQTKPENVPVDFKIGDQPKRLVCATRTQPS